jgi:manganese oxidase
MVLLAGLVLALMALGAGSGSRPSHTTPKVQVNDNRHAVGTLRNGVLTVRLEARVAMWYPDGDSAPGAAVPAFAEVGGPLQIPGPVIRIPAGTDVAVSIHNRVAGAALTVHGLHARPLVGEVATPDTVVVPAGGTREVRFRLSVPGTFYYWGTTTGRSFAGRTHEDAQLSGALVVDPAGRIALPDRILIIGEWADTQGTEAVRTRNRLLLVVNGRSWPHTERLSYTVGDTVRLRVINASADLHPMHLHGFYYEVDSRGDGTSDTTYGPADRDRVVTERLGFGRTMAITWVPDRAGNWLFHCHVPQHFGPRGSLGMMLPPPTPGTLPPVLKNHTMQPMNGLVVGITVRPRTSEEAPARNDGGPRRHLRLLVRANQGSTTARPLYGFALQEGSTEPPPDSGHRSGPAIVLVRGEPVSIMVVNRTPEPTSVHWHGIELESYYDGVAGFSGTDVHPAPLIAPGDSFEARFTPPHAGTFIYHTHVDELRQEPAGLSGPLLVLEPGTGYDTTIDRAILISSPEDSAIDARAVLWNGSLTPPALALQAGVPMRIRFINITVGRPGIRLELLNGNDLASWRVVAKDGAARPESRAGPRPGRQPISIGETVDVEVTPATAGELRVEVRTGQSRLLGTLPLRVSAARP